MRESMTQAEADSGIGLDMLLPSLTGSSQVCTGSFVSCLPGAPNLDCLISPTCDV